MVAKSKKNKDPEVQHLSELLHSELPRVVWEFLLKQAGDSETAFGLKPRQIKDYADDFLFSDEGRFYWPLSSLSQWQYDSTEEEVKKWIAELMSSERKKKHDEDSRFKFDDPLQSSSARKPSTLRKSHPFWARKVAPGASRTMTGEESAPKRTPGSLTKASPVAPSRSTKSPTIFPDVPYEEPSEPPQSTPLKSTRSTPATITVADDRSPEIGGSNAATRRENRRATLGLGLKLRKSPITPRKRPAEDEEEDRPDSSSISFPELRSKRVALDSVPSPQQSPTPSSAHFGELGALLGISREESNSMMPPPKRDQQNSELPAESNSQSSRLQTVNADGLPYTVDKLSQVPERVLGYITECVQHEIRLADRVKDLESKDKHRSRATLFLKLHADLESRIKCLAEDAEEKRRVESSHCLWN
jgi:hypothetical protein